MRYLYWSDESYRIWGFDPLQGLPSRQSMWERIHPEDRDRVWASVQGAVHQKRDFIAEFTNSSYLMEQSMGRRNQVSCVFPSRHAA